MAALIGKAHRFATPTAFRHLLSLVTVGLPNEGIIHLRESCVEHGAPDRHGLFTRFWPAGHFCDHLISRADHLLRRLAHRLDNGADISGRLFTLWRIPP